MNAKTMWTLLKETYQEWRDDKVPRLAAALSYYAAIAAAPLVVGIIAIAGFVFGTEQAKAQLVTQVGTLVSPQAAEMVGTIINSADQPDVARVAGWLSLITLLWGASNIFAQLQDSLDTIWGVELRPDLGLMRKAMHRLLPLLMVLGIGVLLLVAVIASSVLSALGTFMPDLLPGMTFIWQVINFLVSAAVMTFLFALIFKVLPDVEFAWRDVWLGAALTSLLFVVGQFVLGWYLGRQSGSSLYGAAGSLVVFLLWLYYSAQIFLFGAEFTQVYATRYGQGVRPAKDAVPRSATAARMKLAAQGTSMGMPQREPRLSSTAPDRSTQSWRVATTQLDSMPLGALVKSLADDGRMLIRQEMQLLRAEVMSGLAQVARGSALTASGGLLVYAGALGLLCAVALLLYMIMPLWLAALLVGLLTLIEGWILTLGARRRLKQMSLVPKKTFETVREDVEMVKERVAS
ncbi:MAG: YihY family inner membrane protein [Caldilineaceae bacterium]|nr:YihY family inner membrane protein [Caldilineaceae bacterium]